MLVKWCVPIFLPILSSSRRVALSSRMHDGVNQFQPVSYFCATCQQNSSERMENFIEINEFQCSYTRTALRWSECRRFVNSANNFISNSQVHPHVCRCKWMGTSIHFILTHTYGWHSSERVVQCVRFQSEYGARRALIPRPIIKESIASMIVSVGWMGKLVPAGHCTQSAHAVWCEYNQFLKWKYSLLTMSR